MSEAFPLHWPAGCPRTNRPKRSRFDVTFDKARQELCWEIQRLGGKYPVISTNLPLRRDGFPLASAKEPADKAVAVYFMRNGKQMVFACDRWDRIQDNLWAIHKTIEALRGIERWGASDMMERAFSAFEALPPPSWKVDLEFAYDAVVTWGEVVERHRTLAKKYHSDTGNGNDGVMARINAARDTAMRELRS